MNVIMFVIGIVFGWCLCCVIASGKMFDRYTKGYIDSNNHYEAELEARGLKKDGKWVENATI